MNKLHALLVASSLSALVGCRTNPCGDHVGTLPESLRPVGVALAEGKVCESHGELATVMYWGGAEQLNAVTARALAGMAAQGWEQLPPNPWVHEDERNRQYSFRRGADDLSMNFSVTSTPRFGAKFWTDSITVFATHSTAQPTRFRARR